jgi:hypothetical protein
VLKLAPGNTSSWTGEVAITEASRGYPKLAPQSNAASSPK